MRNPKKLERAAAVQRSLTPVANLNAMLPPGSHPLLARPVPAGFPSPADDYIEGCISLDDYLVRHKEATFFSKLQATRCAAWAFSTAICWWWIARCKPRTKSVVIAVLDHEFTVKQLLHTPNGYVLHAANPAYPDIAIKPEQERRSGA